MFSVHEKRKAVVFKFLPFVEERSFEKFRFHDG